MVKAILEPAKYEIRPSQCRFRKTILVEHRFSDQILRSMPLICVFSDLDFSVPCECSRGE